MRVDHEWPTIGVEYDDAILDREGVNRESVNAPLPDFYGFTESGRDGERGGAGNGLLRAEPVPLSDTVSAKVNSEGSQVSHYSRRHQHISYHIRVPA